MLVPLRTLRPFLPAALLALLLLPSNAFAEDDEEEKLEIGRWYPSLQAGLFLSQSAYSDNWAGGDTGQMAWTFLLDGELKQQFNEKWNLHNTLRLAYGQTSKQEADRSWGEPDKSTDRIDFESILRATLGYYLDPYVSVRVESQFEDASDALGRGLLFNPVLVKESLGVAHEFYGEEDRQLLVRLGTALRQTFRRIHLDETDPTNDETEMERTTDGGVELVIDYQNVFFDEAISWTSKTTFFQPLFYSSFSTFEDLDDAALAAAGVDSDIEDFTTTMDIDWENVITGQITEHIAVNLYVRFVYDKYDTSVDPQVEDGMLTNPGAVRGAVRKAGQFQQNLALGITYRFF